MAVSKPVKKGRGVALTTAQWARTFNVVLASFLNEYASFKTEESDPKVNVPVDQVVALAAGVALKIVEVSDGDDA
jgi:hypothetical protein